MTRIAAETIEAENAKRMAGHCEDYDALASRLARNGQNIDDIKHKVKVLSIAIPSWGVGTGGTRFARFPQAGEPRSIWEKIEDCGVIRQLQGLARTVSPHFPWDWTDDWAGLREAAKARALHFDAVNSNTFQDQRGQPHSYKFGSLTHVDPAVRKQAISHNLACIEAGKALHSRALTVWIADGGNFPGQQDLGGAFERYLESMEQIYAALPDDWLIFIEHKLFEPAFYTTVISDWGTSYLAATHLGPKAKCLVDLGHHAPNVNIEQIVARLHRFGKLGGFHFNDSKYGDDDLDSGAINPFQLFLIFNELVIAAERDGAAFQPAYMMDQSHNVTDPIESLMMSADTIAATYAQAVAVDRQKLAEAQAANDALLAHRTLKDAFSLNMAPLVAQARLELGGALDPVMTYRASGYRARVAQIRPPVAAGSAGIV
jgi:L-rhamnose isomerase / sugar isomerase